MIPDVGALHFQRGYYRVDYDPHVLWHLVDQNGTRCCCYNRCREVAQQIADEYNGVKHENRPGF